MRTTFTAGLWFLAAWVSFAMAAFAVGLPSQVTPLVAAAAFVVVASVLVRRQSGSVGQPARLVDASLSDA